MVGLLVILGVLMILFLALFGPVYNAWDTPKNKAIRHFKRVKKAIISEMGKDLKVESTSLMKLCEKELRKLLRARESIKDLRALSSAMSKEVSYPTKGKGVFHDDRYYKENDVLDAQIEAFLEQMLQIHRLAITQEREALLELKGLTDEFKLTMQARREVMEGMTFGSFDEELEKAVKAVKNSS